MAYSYHYVPIGSNPLPENYFSGETPHLLTFSKIKSDITDEATAHLHSHLEIFYFESGFGILTSGDVKIPLMSHCLVVANAQHFHVQHSDSEGAPLVYYNFAVDRLKLPGLSPNTISENAVEIHRFRDADNPFFRIIEEMLSEYSEKKFAYCEKINALFSELFIETIRLFSPAVRTEERKATGSETLMLVKSYIDHHYAENLNLNLLTQISYMQKSHFLHSFKRQFQISPMKYLTLIRMENAKLLLLKSEKNISEIAREVGYNTSSYFSEMFLKVVGESPTAYRKRVKKEI
jgi:AraC-like DNA-binding protein